MATSANSILSELQTTAFTRRCHNVFFRLEQLKALHDKLREHAQDIKSAIIKDTGTTEAEAATEIAHSLNVVRDHYESLNPEKELEEEYRIAKGKNAEDAREPWGVVYIEPQLRHTPFFSILSPMSAALVAGNCIALKFENTLRALPSLLRTLLPQALSSDIFAILSSSPSAESLQPCLQVLQDSKAIEAPTYSQLYSRQGKVIAVVDRTADLSLAAQHITTARFAFNGTSPYAPDLVLVNEFIKKEFLELVLQHTIRFFATSPTEAENIKVRDKSSPQAENAIKQLDHEPAWNTRTITLSSNGAIIELSSKKANALIPLPPNKLFAPVLAISATTSLDHAIDIVSASTSPSDPLIAAYHFCAPAHGKYLAQHIRSAATFINHIPSSLLFGPISPSPSLQHFSLLQRYTRAHFERPVPAYTTSPSPYPNPKSPSSLTPPSLSSTTILASIRKITPRKRPDSEAVGFFEQGIFIGLGVYGVPLLAGIGAVVVLGVRAGLRGLRRGGVL